ncbi:putative transcription factor interactor and regulator CCHC(Zn) family [Helianthus annuus]|nr:putative transcription factor interactor and regulator CCHC(Zn) family [Helianthus annuus]KAJ0518177.1 putative transcription factor interactor and regulator CCHC(Zn) family [Helianthus annuus]KAJ0686206.1 putative transcription factor interactor and regulator CCHC(Zn) family [Helianthus annuus]
MFHVSVERMHTLHDSLRQLQKGNSLVSDFGRKFKSLYDQSIGHPMTDEDKRHWFLCGLGSSFETFSTAQRTVKPSPLFRDLLAHTENHELFLQTLNGPNVPPAAFSTQSSQFNANFKPSRDSSQRGRSCGSSYTRGRSTSRRPPHCQLCRKEGHYASSCPTLSSYAQRAAIPLDANLAQAFHAQCNIVPNTPHWKADSGATMITPSVGV